MKATSLIDSGIREEPGEDGEEILAVQSAAEALAVIGSRPQKGNTVAAGPVKLGAGLTALPGLLAGKIRRGEYVDFAEFPPATPDGTPSGSHSTEQLLIVQAADLRWSRRKVSDVGVWTRCYILYMGAVAKEEPGRLLDLLGYMDAIIRASQKFAWPACEEYDRCFHQMVAGDESRQWAMLDAGLYTECFTAQTLGGARDPFRGTQSGYGMTPRKRPRTGADQQQSTTEQRQGPQYVGNSTSIGGTADLARDAGSCTCAADAEAPTQCRTVRLSTGSRVKKKTTNEQGGGGAVHLSEYQNVIVSFECPCVI